MAYTYKLQIRQTNIYDAADGFQLLLRAMEPNQFMFLWEDATVAACKTKATAIFKNNNGSLTYVGDVSKDTSGTHNELIPADSGQQGTDLLWATALLTL